MLYNIYIHSDKELDMDAFFDELDMPFEKAMLKDFCLFFYPDKSTTIFQLSRDTDGIYSVGLSGMASFHDYRLLPYLADCLNVHLNGEGLTVDGRSVYDVYDEEWAEDCIGDAVAQMKVALVRMHKFYVPAALLPGTYVSEDMLRHFGVTKHSSTPRIYGYMQYILKNAIAPAADEEEISRDFADVDFNEMTDVPQHVSIGRVRSWQTDGSETWESFAQDDVDALLEVGRDYRKGGEAYGVVLNDLGTIYQEGIGVEKDGRMAEYWFCEACRQGDRTYAPSNLGDIYRKGCGEVTPSAEKAFKAYMMSDDPYAHYRIGQAYEEGWTGVKDMAKAMEWYRKAADEGHHLAIKRLMQDGKAKE